MESSSSSSSTPPYVALPAGDYEVFLSFRGPDVRNGFADHLYTSLARAKIRTFMDEEELQKGEGIAPSLVRAIPESKIYIPILSERYASSKWCLLELAQMVDCWKQGKGHLILPIFYLVKPRDVRHQEGPYHQAFEQQHAHKHSPQTVKEWKEALREVGQLKGWHITESRGEGAIVDEVLSKVESHLRSMYALVTDELVGIDTPMEEVMKLLNLESSKERVILGIHGMGGLGKTTLSKAVYNKICAQFDRCCYLEDAREVLAKSDGVVSLQNKVISTILESDHHVQNASEGINMIKNRVCKHKLLLVVDDIDDKFEFNKILGKLGDFSSGSRFILTTRYTRVLDFILDCKLYEPREMSHHHSLQLFSKHAFGMNNPPEEDAGISKEFVKVATGLPLALKVIGSLLYRRKKKFWEEKLKELQSIPSSENMLQERLKVSYTDLSHNEKQIFLDIACFFAGSHKDIPYYMWSGCDFYPESGITNLINRSLLKLDKRNQFWMHDLIKDLGRAIVREDVRNPYNRSRIWSTDDALDMLRNREGSERVEVVRIDVKFTNDHDKLLTSKEFEKLSGLRYLEVRYGRMMGDFSQVLPNICCLRLYKCGSIPTNVNTKKLTVLDMEGSNVMDDWKGWSGMKATAKLKAVNIRNCELTRSPDLSTCTSLEFINFTGCSKVKGQIRIGKFKNLQKLILTGIDITELIIRGGGIGQLRRLEEMDLSWTNLRELPNGMENLSSLKILSLGSADCMEIPRLPTSLKRLSVSYSSRVPNLVELNELEFLCYLRADNPWIPGDLWRLPNLKELRLKHSRCDGPLLQDDQDQEATSPAAAAAAALPTSLTSLHVEYCLHLSELPSLSNLCNLTRLQLWCVGVAEIRGLGELSTLETLAINSLNLNNLNGLENLLLLRTLTLSNATLERLPSLVNLSKLKDLEVCDCPNLVEIQGLAGVGESLTRLKISRCPRLADLDGLQHLVALVELIFYEQSFRGIQTLNLSGLFSLKQLNIRRWRELLVVKGLDRLVWLERLTMEGCTSIRQLPDLSELGNLKELHLSGCQSLIHLVGIQRLESLQRLLLPRCSSITNLPNLSGLRNLETLDLQRCVELTEVEGVEGLESLRWLLLSECRSVTKLTNLSSLKSLETLHLSECVNLTEVEGVEGLESLTRLQLYNCRSITELGNLSGLEKLEELNIMGCTKLMEVNGLDELEKLRYLEMGRKMRVKYLAKSAARYGLRLAGGAPVVGRLVSWGARS
ncbi:unnamed protein product [Linum trigynum]|uniref:TIR domain-containing protein n=1 Tax=Linum trigynum TaxID=586398 RepID=A0AAV2G1Z5_9ROSI